MAYQQSKSGSVKFNDLKNRLLFLLGALIIYRIGTHIPVPGVDAAILAKAYQNQSAGILGMLNMFSGGSLERFSIFAIGIMPYISASIVMQLASEILPSLKSLKKEGDAGRRVITKYTRIGTVLLATLQSIGVASLVYSQENLVIVSKFEFYISAIVCLVGGTMFLMWLGEQMTERGIGNGISLIITAGIAAGIPSGIKQLLTLLNNDSTGVLQVIAIGLGVIFLVYIVVCFESALRKVPIHYAKRQVIGGQNTHMPFKLNMSGVIPPIFASSLIMFPATIGSWLGNNQNETWLTQLVSMLGHGQTLYLLLFSFLIIFFCYFYTALVFSPKEMAENLKKSGAFIPNIRPGEQTANYLEKLVMRLTFFGALYITSICLLPELLTLKVNIPFYLGGTSLLILVVVTMDFSTQIASYKMTERYEHFNMKSLSRK
ncbi:preprotein translocase subunit SecY [Neisseria wadsworthii]|uniref:Protein translocase subunit SecY n=1 Tax=Neisseria wadsworthii 9715 TaxID=1030841 RepID=G4CNS1_9NEIS|nr:preprotein translocase subunit SecY [Neisseria wadsworthii]EGZ49139.1 preprotein translocase subunit SecY [Neisseria wadsworthii 9715]QMT36680.1 preprotein translocase subunit SecY [Neisseria wadsworthii]